MESRKFDFDHWQQLYRSDPAEFERQRHAALKDIIEQAPDSLKRRLEGALFKIEMQRRKAANPLHGVILASSMMWEAFHDLNVQLNTMANAGNAENEPVAGNETTPAKSPDPGNRVIPLIKLNRPDTPDKPSE